MKLKPYPLGHQTGKSLVILATALLLLLGQSLLFLYEAGEIRARGVQQEAASTVLLRLREVLSDLQDAETGQRGYLLTGTDVYLEPHRRAVVAVGEHLRALKTLLAADERRSDVLRVLQTAVQRKFAELDETIRLRRAGDTAGALQRVQDGSGKREMDEARALLGTLMDEVRSERKALSAEAAHLVGTAAYILVSIALTIIAMVCVATVQMMRIIDKNHELSVQLEKESTHDALTGLPNRRLFNTWLDKALGQAARKHATPAVLFIDLDGFKGVNDDFGHETGDAVLRAATARFALVVRSSDLLARLGGDEFAIVVNENLTQDGLAALALRVLEALRAPLLPSLAAGAIGASIGIAIFPAHGDSPASLVAAADEAMYSAKRAGKGRFRFAAEGA
jgi:diguanylate cyclase